MNEEAKRIGREIRDLLEQITVKMTEAKSKKITVNFRVETDQNGKTSIGAFEVLTAVDLDKTALN